MYIFAGTCARVFSQQYKLERITRRQLAKRESFKQVES